MLRRQRSRNRHAAATAFTATTARIPGIGSSKGRPARRRPSPGGDDFIVQFTYPPDAKSTNHCAIYSLNEYGVSLDELKKVAEDLRLKQ